MRLFRKGRKIRQNQRKSLWLVTFSDLVTLLLALFVLIFSMSTLDSISLREISSSLSQETENKRGGPGRSGNRYHLAAQILRDTDSIEDAEAQVKELLIAKDFLPEGLDVLKINTSFKITKRAEGIVFSLIEDLSFAPGMVNLSADNKKLLLHLAPLFKAMGADMLITGYANQSDSSARAGTLADLNDEYDFAQERSLVVLDLMINAGLIGKKLSISAYTANAPQSTEDTKPLERKVEILVKTTKTSGRYS